jgi:uncharacterized RDD family membrane protein YckC
MQKLRQYYQILGVNPGAPLGTIRGAYRDSINVWHPDRFTNNPRLQEKAQEKTREIIEAYERITAFFNEYGAPNFAESPGDANTQSSKEPPPVSPKPHYAASGHAGCKGKPWRRFWARQVDFVVFGSLTVLLFTLLFPQSTVIIMKEKDPAVRAIALWPFILPLILLMEAAILTLTGTTLGKWLLGISLIPKKSGGEITFLAALYRCLSLWALGLAFGLPVVSLITMALAAGRIRKTGAASWDDSSALEVHYRVLDTGKVFLVVALLVISFGFEIQSELTFQNLTKSTASPVLTPSNQAIKYVGLPEGATVINESPVAPLPKPQSDLHPFAGKLDPPSTLPARDSVKQQQLKQQRELDGKIANAQFAKDYPDILADPVLLAEANKRYYAKVIAGESIIKAMAEAGKETRATKSASIPLDTEASVVMESYRLYPFLDNTKSYRNVNAINQVRERRFELERQGVSTPQAIRQAVAEIAPLYVLDGQ